MHDTVNVIGLPGATVALGDGAIEHASAEHCSEKLPPPLLTRLSEEQFGSLKVNDAAWLCCGANMVRLKASAAAASVACRKTDCFIMTPKRNCTQVAPVACNFRASFSIENN